LELPAVPFAESITSQSADRLTPGPRTCAAWRVLLLVSNLTLDGGAEVQSVQLAQRLKARGWDVTVVSMLPPKDADLVLRADGIPVLALDVESRADAPGSVLRLAGVFSRLKPHIVHCHMPHAILLARAARLIRPVPVMIGTLHGLKMYNVRGTGWRAREMAHWLTGWLSDATTVVCRAAALRYGSPKTGVSRTVRLVPNGVDTERFHPDSEIRALLRDSLEIGDDFVWLLPARFQPVKDHCTMLRAFRQVVAHHSTSLLLMAGGGPLEREMKELAHALEISPRVRFLGPRSDMASLMKAADACVLSSIYEGMPLVLLEAAASGLPAVATDVGGNSDVVIDGVTGFLAPSANPGALADAMLRLATLPAASRLDMGREARRNVGEKYRFDVVVDQWEALYNELLARKRVPR
jgi:glycosyltransferase involved in cell wall biosynthesis